MSDCLRIRESLASYADGLLGPDERDGVERHLAACPSCRRQADEEESGRRVLRHAASKLLAEPLPPGLRARCQSLTRAREGPAAALGVGGPWWRVRLVPLLLTIVVMVFTASAFLSLATRRSDALLAAQLTADHSKCFKLVGPPDKMAVDIGKLERVLAQQSGHSVHIPPSSTEDGVEFLGARRCLYGDGIVPHVMYRVHGQDVSLFVLAGAERKPDDLVTLGHRSQIWSKDGTTFVLVSPVDADGLASASRYVMREAR
jgi:anti-sigma factor (TIGR02949 family)